MAAFCVALLALVYVETAHANDHLANGDLIYAAAGHVIHTHEEAGHEPASGGAEHESSEPHAHHCSMTHAAPAHSGGVSLGCNQRALSAFFVRNDSWRLTSRLYGLERPPRA